METDLSPYLAPLSRPLINTLASPGELRLSTSLNELVQDFHEQWIQLITRVKQSSTKVYQIMAPTVAANTLSTNWLIDQLAQASPHDHRLSPETISRWRDQNLLCYQGRNKPNQDNAAALLIVRMLTDTKKITRWLPNTTITKEEPLWWCWRQDSPTSPVIPCPIPLPEDIPSHALLWTNWLGASWQEEWLSVGKLGAARWAGTLFNTEKKSLLWDISEEALQQWDPEISPFSHGVLSDIAPLTMHTLSTLALLRLATSRLQKSIHLSQL
jgi:hypothetical protein